jgi:hypothetical protein
VVAALFVTATDTSGQAQTFTAQIGLKP